MLSRRLLLCGAGAAWAAPAPGVTLLYGDREVAVPSRVEKGDLWIRSADLPKVNEFVVKPQGACREDLCIPLPKTLKNGPWLNLSGFARKVKQSLVNEGSLWSFGEMPVLRSGLLQTRTAPDFAVADRKGKLVHLSDFRGKKVFLLTWASW